MVYKERAGRGAFNKQPGASVSYSAECVMPCLWDIAHKILLTTLYRKSRIVILVAGFLF